MVLSGFSIEKYFAYCSVEDVLLLEVSVICEELLEHPHAINRRIDKIAYIFLYSFILVCEIYLQRKIRKKYLTLQCI
jgi:hypothetical protein